ncbi:iron ABC transporter substrate-binding protein [Enemella evansiae]|uniref:iron ABC transporter substrate-binding protein n=1 Tax=Enemella evansiae TaxID=2016499 RepID=UPI000B97708A|nr:iron ABC transporter substrate-binding protein [Enemella evansiae]OYO01937.1 iron ABC transporter substrate-binding protein [Enemella evansiae]
MSQLSRRGLLGVLAASPVVALAACGGQTQTQPGAGAASGGGTPTGTITLYNAQHESLGKAWAEAFTKASGVKVEIRQGSDTEMSNQILKEGERSPADVFLTENSPAMVQVANAGLFAPVDAKVAANVPDTLRPGSGAWTGIAARATVFAYNPTKIPEAELPKSLLDLADPKWNGRWAASPTGADFQAIVSALLQLKGSRVTADWLTAMKAGSKPYKGNSTAMKAVNAGEVDGAVIYHYYWFGDQAKTKENSKNVKLHYFRNQDPGAFVSVSGGGVLKGAKNPTAANAFLAHITSVEGQAEMANYFEYPVNPQAKLAPGLVPIADLQPPTIDIDKLNGAEVTKLMTDAGLI